MTDKLFPDSLKSYLFASVRNLALNQLERLDPLKQACDIAYYESPWEEYDNFEEEVFQRVEVELKNYHLERKRSFVVSI